MSNNSCHISSNRSVHVKANTVECVAVLSINDDCDANCVTVLAKCRPLMTAMPGVRDGVTALSTVCLQI